MKNKYTYNGDELQLFSKAKNWKRYIQRFIKPYLYGNVLEVGAGIGSTTKILCDGSQDKWSCLEPDRQLYSVLLNKIYNNDLPKCCDGILGEIKDIINKTEYDTILYIDVLEHIYNDKLEIENIYSLLKAGGHLIILAPAHNWLYSNFDKHIGHYRRYNRKTLKDAIPEGYTTIQIKYLDSLGIIASLMNRLILSQSIPNERQIKLWDNIIISISKYVDIITRYKIGKSILGVWKKVDEK